MASTMSTVSSITIIPPDPDILPAAIGPSKSSGISSRPQSNSVPSLWVPLNRSSARRIFAEDPPGITALSERPGRAPADTQNHFTEGKGSAFKFIVSRTFYLAGNAPDTGTRVVGLANFGEFIPTHIDNVFHITKGFNIVDDRWALIKTKNCREIRRLIRGLGRLPSRDSINPVSSPQM